MNDRQLPYPAGRGILFLAQDYTCNTYLANQQADGLLERNRSVGVITAAPSTTLDVNGGLRTKYSGDNMVDGDGGEVHTLDITLPNAVPADRSINNTVWPW